LHKLAVESALAKGERPKITLYEDMIYLEFYGLRLAGEEIETDEIGIFVGEKFLITVRRAGFPKLDHIRTRWNDDQGSVTVPQTPGRIRFPWASHHADRRPPSTAILLYAILDDLVDGYFPVVDWLGDQIEELESIVMGEKVREPQVAIQEMRTRLLRLRRLLSPQQEVLNTMLRRDVPIIPEAIIPYFADVHDHVLRIHDWMESYRDQLSTIVDLQLSMQSNRLNGTMRTLTAWSIILMGSSLIAGIYGMNFDHMPELQWHYGYGFALLLMLTIAVGLFTTFRRLGWWK
jgi:magnesium transporter